MRRRRYPCWAWAPLIALPLLLLATCVPGKGIVDRDLARRANAALTKTSVPGVTARFSWGRGVLTGPEDQRDTALVVVAALVSKKDRYKLRYVADGSVTPTTTTTTTAPSSTTAAARATTTIAGAPAPTTTPTTAVAVTTSTATTATPAPPTTTIAAAGVSVDASGDVTGSTITLTGRVATAAQKTAIVNAATAAFGAARVVDQLTVAGAAAAPGTDEAVTRYAALLGQLGPRLSAGRATIKDTAIVVTGTGFNAGAVTEMNAAVQAANGGGVTATGSLQAAQVGAADLQAQLASLLGRSGINFAPDSADIDAASTAVLDTAAASIVALPSVKVAIKGFTDNAGAASANQVLSQRRAEAVLTYLVGKGVSAGQLTAQGFGPAQPIADNSTPEGRAANRRIEFAVTGS